MAIVHSHISHYQRVNGGFFSKPCASEMLRVELTRCFQMGFFTEAPWGIVRGHGHFLVGLGYYYLVGRSRMTKPSGNLT